jgi:predicted membrane protein
VFGWMAEPRTLVLLVALAVLTAVFGRFRREPRLTIAMNTIGVVAAWAGMFWAAALGTPALGAVVLAFIGAYLMTTTYERGRTNKKQRAKAEGHA